MTQTEFLIRLLVPVVIGLIILLIFFIFYFKSLKKEKIQTQKAITMVHDDIKKTNQVNYDYEKMYNMYLNEFKNKIRH